MSNETKVTTDLAEIQRFAEGRDAVPATVRDTMEGDEPGVLSLDFLGYGAGEESLEHIGWDAWYEKFNAAKLALLYQEHKADGEPSTFFKLVDRDDAGAGDGTGGADAAGDTDAVRGGAGDASAGGVLSDDEATAAMAMSLPEAGETKATTVLEEIQRFAQGCDAVPATVRDTMEGDEPGVLSLDFLGYGAGEESLEHIDWDAWYDKFESENLAFLYQERKADGEPSTFFKLVDRDTPDEVDTGSGRAGGTGDRASEADDRSGQADDASEQARVRATVGASGSGTGGTLRATFSGSEQTGTGESEAGDAPNSAESRADAEDPSFEPPEPGEAKATTELAEIQRFAQGCDAVPATVRDTMEGDEPGVLSLDFLGYGAGEESLEHIDWDAWYDKFESENLAFLYQERKADGEPSTFFKLVDRDRAED